MGDDGFFDGGVAQTYDRVHGGSDTKSVQQMVDVLSQLSFEGPALEFAIGTGRIALPLRDRGIQVSGIELSKAMIAELRKKENGTPTKVIVGDMVNQRFEEKFALVYLVYNTIDNLTSLDAQLACFENAAFHLKPGGRFLIETLVPPIQKVPFGETILANDCSTDHWGIDEFDIVTQNYTSHHIRMDNGGFKKMSVPFRYAWPSELDLMAKSAGLQREHRWSDWNKSAFTRFSTSHISVWRKPDR